MPVCGMRPFLFWIGDQLDPPFRRRDRSLATLFHQRPRKRELVPLGHVVVSEQKLGIFPARSVVLRQLAPVALENFPGSLFAVPPSNFVEYSGHKPLAAFNCGGVLYWYFWIYEVYIHRRYAPL